MGELAPVIGLCRHRWNLPVVCELGDGPRGFVELRDALAANRDSLARSLRGLAEPGWIRRAGPHYALSPAGERIAPACRGIVGRLEPGDEILLDRWALPVLCALAPGALRFNELKAVLGDVTSRALAACLHRLAAGAWIEREVLGGYPPGTSYRLGPRAEPLRARVSALRAPTRANEGR